jgi:hypothetical protein
VRTRIPLLLALLLCLPLGSSSATAAAKAAAITSITVEAGVPTITWTVGAPDEMVVRIQIAHDAQFQQLVDLGAYDRIDSFVQRTWSAKILTIPRPLDDGAYFARVLWRNDCHDSGLPDHYGLCTGPSSWSAPASFNVVTVPTLISGVTVTAGVPTVYWTVGASDQMVTQIQVAHDAAFSRLALPDTEIRSFLQRSWTPGVPLENGPYFVRLLWRDRCQDLGNTAHDGLCIGGPGTWTTEVGFAVSDAPPPPPPPPPSSEPPPKKRLPNDVFLSYRILGGSIRYARIRVTYTVEPPSGCPESAPDDVLSSDWSDWTSDYCQDYVLQHATLVFRIYQGRRLLYIDEGEGLGRVSNDPAVYGGKWETYIFKSQLRKPCRVGPITLRVALLDPYRGRTVRDTVDANRKC